MNYTMLKGKIHRAVVKQADLKLRGKHHCRYKAA